MLKGNGPDRVKTCENCVRAKIRCTRTPTSPICDRCRRLNKDCYFRPVQVRKLPTKRSSRIDHLESKVDKILGQINTPSPQQRRQEESPSHSPGSGESQGLDAIDIIGRGIVSPSEANLLLNYWRQEVAPGFPFVVVSDHWTVEDLRSGKPFLLLAILFTTSFQDIALNGALDEVIKSYVGNSVAQGAWNRDYSLDLLQGLLVVIAGSKTIMHLNRLSYYMQLAIAVLYELRIDRAPKIRSIEPRIDVVEKANSPRTSQAIANAESRLLIGFYVVQSIECCIIQKSSTLPWSSFMEASARNLSEKCEYPSDRYMVHYVQSQHLLDRINYLATSGIAQRDGLHGELDRHVRAFRTEVEEHKNQLPFPVNADFLIGAQCCALELHLCQISLFDTDPNATSNDGLLLNSKIDTLCHGLAAAKRFYDYYAASMALGQERGFTYIQWMQTGFTIALACKLTLAALDPSLRHNLHVQELREALDLTGRLRLFQIRMSHIDRQDSSLPEHKRKHVLSHYEKWLNCVAEWFDGKYRAALADPMAGITSTMSSYPTNDSQYSDNNIGADGQDQNLFWMELQDMSIEEILSWMGPMDFAG